MGQREEKDGIERGQRGERDGAESRKTGEKWGRERGNREGRDGNHPFKILFVRL